MNGNVQQDCGYANCTIDDFMMPMMPNPTWFPPNNAPPDPVNWFKDPIYEQNLCYYAPQGYGQLWVNHGLGCHNPRLDLDNIFCDPTVTDPNSADFCAPENINIDFPPKSAWMRIGVFYYSNHSYTYTVHPNVKIFCDGALMAELGSHGYYDPEAPIQFTAPEGDGTNNKFWMVADVAFIDDPCAEGCVVQPLYSNPTQRIPVFVSESSAESNFGPGYPPLP